jgi:hypothetical protein
LNKTNATVSRLNIITLCVDAGVACLITAFCSEEVQSLSIILGNGKLNELPKLWLQNG